MGLANDQVGARRPFSWPFLILSVLLGGNIFLYLFHYRDQALDGLSRLRPHATNDHPPGTHTEPHPIDLLIKEADARFADLLSKETFGVDAAAAAYRQARGRHPPPRFDRWVRWCEEHGVVMIEKMYDQLAWDLEPFWGVNATLLGRMSSYWRNVIRIRNGTVSMSTATNIQSFMRAPAYLNTIKNQLPLEDVPDIDLMFNMEDAPLGYPLHATVENALRRAAADQQANPPTRTNGIRGDFAVLDPNTKLWPDQIRESPPPFEWADYPVGMSGVSVFDVVKQCCAPDSAAAHVATALSFDSPAYPWFANVSEARHLYHGFVKDYSGSKYVCDYPVLREIHGHLVAGSLVSGERDDLHISSVLHGLVPVLSDTKMGGIRGDIVVPPAMQLEDGPVKAYSMKQENMLSWREKQPTVYWLGSAAAGLFNTTNWTRFARHRFMALTSASIVEKHMRWHSAGQPLPAHVPDDTNHLIHNFPLPGDHGYSLGVVKAKDNIAAVSEWISRLTTTGFSNMLCAFAEDGCPVMEAAGYTLRQKQPQAENWRHKFLPDVDGVTFSGRFRAFLRSNSMPIKATMFDEWHDSRYIPWYHFVPMDNSFVDFYGIMEYFAGYKPPRGVEGVEVPAHDAAAQKIAHQGAQWSRRVGRTEDQVAYYYRLILELARIMDERRLDLGFVDDIVKFQNTSAF